MRAFSQIEIYNLAIARLPAEPIVSVDEDSLPARECRRFYPEVLSDMLEGPHDWGYANQRVRLAMLATNDRPSEWAYAYQVPSNVGNAIRVLPDLESLGLGLPVPLPGDPYAESWGNLWATIEMPYEIDGQTLYTDASGASLDYTINDIAGVPVPGLAVTAFTIDLAARICVPVKKDSAREKELVTAAEVAWQRAIADDNNRQPQQYGEYTPESIAVRHQGG